MPKYKITAESNEYPSWAPASATIEKVSSIPLSLTNEAVLPGTKHVIDVQRSIYDDRAAYLRIEDAKNHNAESVHLTSAEAIEVADALYELVGKAPIQALKRDYAVNDRVRLIDADVSYVGRTETGAVGVVTATTDDDQEVYVNFGTRSYYVKFYALTPA